MSAHLTEEEQLEALKRWWKENGTSTMASIVIAVAAYFSWQFWQTNQQAQAEAASGVFQQMMEAAQPQAGQALSDESRATASHLAGELKANYSGSLYAKQAAMLLAKLAVESNELDKAAEELKWVLSQSPSAAVKALTNLRLAKVFYAQSKFDEVIATLGKGDAGAYGSAYEELKGDALLAKSEPQSARAAYQLALDTLATGEGARRTLLEMKLNDLKTAAAANEADTTESEATEPETTEPESAEPTASENDSEGEDA